MRRHLPRLLFLSAIWALSIDLVAATDKSAKKSKSNSSADRPGTIAVSSDSVGSAPVCVSANGQQVIPPLTGDIFTLASMCLSFDSLFSTMEYSIEVESSRFTGTSFFVNGAALYCGAPGEGDGGLGLFVADIDVNQTGGQRESFLRSIDLAPVDCFGLTISTLEALRTGMQEGVIYLEIDVADANDSSLSAYARGQVYL